MTIGVVIAEGDRGLNNQLAKLIEKDHKFRLKGKALTGLETISHVMRQRPDVLVLSSNMPDLDIPSIVKRIMKQYPTPILILHRDGDEDNIVRQIKRMDIGIIDFIKLSNSGTSYQISEVSLTTRLHILSKLNVEKFKVQIQQGISQTKARMKKKSNLEREPSQTKEIINSNKVRKTSYSGAGRSSKLIVIGSSTGGPRLLSQLVPKFPKNLPPVVIVQHMPVGFINAFSKRLNRLSKIRVKEAVSGETLMPGTVYLAPGGKHLEFHRVGRGIPKVLLTDGKPVNFVKPAVDVTLLSAVKSYGGGVISVILTGMGSDGRDGSKMVKEKGGIVLALNEEDSDIYGMNRAVIEAGLADDVLGKKDIVLGIIRAIEGKI